MNGYNVGYIDKVFPDYRQSIIREQINDEITIELTTKVRVYYKKKNVYKYVAVFSKYTFEKRTVLEHKHNNVYYEIYSKFIKECYNVQFLFSDKALENSETCEFSSIDEKSRLTIKNSFHLINKIL